MTSRPLLVLLVALLALAGCGGSADHPPSSARGSRVVIVGQNFTEADVMSQLYRALLDQAGFDATVRPVGSRDLYLGPLGKGTVDVAADTLTATAQTLAHRGRSEESTTGSTSASTAYDQLQTLASSSGVTVLKPTRAQLATAYAVTRRFATTHHLRTLSDLARLHQPLRLAGGPDCAQRADCAKGLESVYGLHLSAVSPLGADTADTKAALTNGQAQLAQVTTTDSTLTTGGLVVLDDDRHIVDAENLAPLVNTRWLHAHPRAREALDRLVPVLTTTDLRAMTARVNAGAEAATVAQEYLERTKLVSG